MADYLVGLDLGKSSDPTALAILKRTLAVDEHGLPSLDRRGEPIRAYACGHLIRYPLGTPYPNIVKEVSALMRKPGLGSRPVLVVDATGVGKAVVDMFVNADLGPETLLRPITITAGTAVSLYGWGAPGVIAYNVAKIELVGTVRAALESGRLKFAKGMPLADTCKKELLNFQVKITESANETFGAWRSGTHDDLVLAVALATWLGNRREVEYQEGDEDIATLVKARALAEAQEAEAARLEYEAAAREWQSPDNPAWWTDLS